MRDEERDESGICHVDFDIRKTRDDPNDDRREGKDEQGGVGPVDVRTVQ